MRHAITARGEAEYILFDYLTIQTMPRILYSNKIMNIKRHEQKALDHFAKVMEQSDRGSLNYDRAVMIRSWICSRIRNRERNEATNNAMVVLSTFSN